MRYKPWIRSHHAGDICPDLNLPSSDGSADDRCSKIRSASAECGGNTCWVRCYKTRVNPDTRRMLVHLFPDAFKALLIMHSRCTKRRIGDQTFSRIQPNCIQIFNLAGSG